MSKLIKDSTLHIIADAIRGKTQTSDLIKVKDFASVIANMETGATEGMFCWAKYDGESELPPGFKQVEYIETSGVEYFNTGYMISPSNFSKIKVVADMAFVGTAARHRVDGCGSSSGISFYFGLNGSSMWTYGKSTSSVSTGVTGDNNRHTFTYDIKNGAFSISGTSVNITGISFNIASGVNAPYIIGGYSTGDGVTPEAVRIYDSYAFCEDEELVHLYYTYKDADNTPCLYDAITKTVLYATGGTPISGEKLHEATPLGYALSDNLNAYPQDGYHSDGYYYRLMENDIEWDERGQYAWAKEDRSKTGNDSYSSSSTVTINDLGGGYYSATKIASSDWGNAIAISDSVLLASRNPVLTYEVQSATVDIFFGFINNKTYPRDKFTEVSYGTMQCAFQAGAGKVITAYELGVSKGQVYSNLAVGDIVEIRVETGSAKLYVNGVSVYTYTSVPDELFAGVSGYYTNATIGKFKLTSIVSEATGYVVTNTENAYPDEGYADDGYYYVKVGATKVTPVDSHPMKYATGTVNASKSATITVSGLGFRPYAVCATDGSSTVSFGICNASGTSVAARYKYSTAAVVTASFSTTDNGFTIQYINSNSSFTLSWWAIGQ